MNYYKQGDAAKADKIKAAFERLGINVLDFGFADKTVVYCSIGGCGGCVQYLPYSINLMNILYSHPGYTELPLSVEHKFKVHDWVVDGDRVAIIYDLQKNGYVGHDVNRRDFVCRYSDESRLRLWTIADAKDGDVLVTTKIRSCPFIYRKTSYKNNLAYYYAGIDGNGDFSEGCLKRTLCHFGLVSDVIPATKEQRDLLFQKMKEAGYEWNVDKKELRKIQPHYDIKNFKPFDKVLVRFCDGANWCCALFSHYCTRGNNHFVCSGGTFGQKFNILRLCYKTLFTIGK